MAIYVARTPHDPCPTCGRDIMIVQDGKNNCLFCDMPDKIQGDKREFYSKAKILKRIEKAQEMAESEENKRYNNY